MQIVSGAVVGGLTTQSFTGAALGAMINISPNSTNQSWFTLAIATTAFAVPYICPFTYTGSSTLSSYPNIAVATSGYILGTTLGRESAFPLLPTAFTGLIFSEIHLNEYINFAMSWVLEKIKSEPWIKKTLFLELASIGLAKQAFHYRKEGQYSKAQLYIIAFFASGIGAGALCELKSVDPLIKTLRKPIFSYIFPLISGMTDWAVEDQLRSATARQRRRTDEENP